MSIQKLPKRLLLIQMLDMRTLVIDTSYLIYRSFFAYPHLSHGENPTGALFGVIKTTMSLCKEYSIDQLVFALDLPGKTWRHETYTEYKAGRPEMDQSMRQQIPLVIEWARKVTPNVLSQERYEADDMIASVVRQKKSEEEVFILSSDRDLYQLLDSNNITFLKGTKGGYMLYTKDNFVAEFGIQPNQYTDYKALVGDGSDNIKGVPGIGPKSATKILNKIGTLKNLFESMNWDCHEQFRDGVEASELFEWVSNPKNHELLNKIYQNRDSLFLAYTLSLLHPQPIVLQYEKYDFARGMDIYVHYQFRSIVSTFSPAVRTINQNTISDENVLF